MAHAGRRMPGELRRATLAIVSNAKPGARSVPLGHGETVGPLEEVETLLEPVRQELGMGGSRELRRHSRPSPAGARIAGGNNTPGFRIPSGSSARLAAPSVAPKSAGRWTAYHGM